MEQGFTYNQIMTVIIRLIEINEIRENIYIAGGVVPYLINGTKSKRLHGDIDCIVDINNMNKLRKILKTHNLYNNNYDSSKYSELDYGFSITINNIPIGFYPFFTEENTFFQRSFTVSSNKSVELKERKLNGIKKHEVLKHCLFENKQIGIIAPEVIYASKINCYRSKDNDDLEQLQNIDLNEQVVKKLIDLEIGNISKWVVNK